MKTIIPLALLIASFVFTGCVSARYKRVKPEKTPPAVVLNVAVVQPPVETMVNTVIVFQGPGSWKREAYWDEYVLTIVNRGAVPLTVQSASLVGLAGQPAAPGSEPWALEKTSRTLEEQRFGLAKTVGVQIGGGLTAITAGAATGLAFIAAAGATSGIYPLAYASLGGIVALPVFVGGSIYRNISSRHDIEREFQHRRLVLPATLVPQQVAQGSLFFPITPGPQRLTFRCRTDSEPFDVVIVLTPLGGLHLTNASKATPIPAKAAPN